MMLVATFRGIIPSFVEMCAKSLGARVTDSELVGDRWKGQDEVQEGAGGSLELTELELQFDAD